MGCFNTTGSISKMPIEYGDKVFAMLVIRDTSVGGSSDFAPGHFITPITLPIFGIYDDYGKLTDIERDANVEYIEKYFGCGIDEIIEIVDDHLVDRYQSKDQKKKYTAFTDKCLANMRKRTSFSGYLKKHVDNMDLVFVMDHRFVFETMRDSYDMIYRYERYNVEESYEKTCQFGWNPEKLNLRDEDYWEKREEVSNKFKQMFPRDFYNPITYFGQKSNDEIRTYFDSTEYGWGEMLLEIYKDEPDFFGREEIKNAFIGFIKFYEYMKNHCILINLHNYHNQSTCHKSLVPYLEAMMALIQKKVEKEREIDAENEDDEN